MTRSWKRHWTQEEEALFRSEYFNKKQHELARMFGIGRTSVVRKAKELNLRKDTVEDRVRCLHTRELEERFGGSIKKFLEHYHWDEMLTVQQMQQEKNIGARASIKKAMVERGIPVRGQSEAMTLRWKTLSEEERARIVRAANAKTREMAKAGVHPFQVLWKENPELLIQYARENAKKMDNNGPNNGMYGKFGAKHPNWNPKRTKEFRIKFRKTTEHRQWLKAVYEKDNYTCQLCGYDKGGTLNAHHLFSYADYEGLRQEVSNGVTLCKPCHVGFHEIYGFGMNTKAQFDEYRERGKTMKTEVTC